jgi:hypothetical protein
MMTDGAARDWTTPILREANCDLAMIRMLAAVHIYFAALNAGNALMAAMERKQQ